MRALNFGMFTTFYPPYNFGGDGIGIQRLSRALAGRGHDVTVVHDADAYNALAPKPDPPDPTPDDGVRRIALKSGVGTLSSLVTQQTGRPLVTRNALQRIIDEHQFDVIWFHNVSLIGGPGILEMGSTVKVYEAHEHWLVCPTHVLWRHGREVCTERQCIRCVLAHRRPPQLWRHTGYLERQLHHVHAFIAKSEFSRTKHAEFGFPAEMQVVPYFLPDTPQHTPAGESPHDRPYYLFVGRLEKIKGLDDVLPLFKGPGDADLLIAGDGTYTDTLKQLAGGAERIRFLGNVSPDALSPLYRHANALIVPSVCYETFGIILIEAFRQGTPVLARRIGPFPELVEQSGAGEIFADPNELQEAMDRFAGDPGRRARLSTAAKDAFSRYWSEDAVIPQYLDVVKQAAHKANRPDIVGAIEENARA